MDRDTRVRLIEEKIEAIETVVFSKIDEIEDTLNKSIDYIERTKKDNELLKGWFIGFGDVLKDIQKIIAST